MIIKMISDSIKRIIAIITPIIAPINQQGKQQIQLIVCLRQLYSIVKGKRIMVIIIKTRYAIYLHIVKMKSYKSGIVKLYP